MEFRFDVPCDWRFPESSRARDVYWCSTCDFGQVWPRPQPEEIDGFYPNGYYTHSETGETGDGKDTRSWVSRLRQHVAWRTSYEQADTPAYLSSFLSDSLPPRYAI
jgi:hypothetical protein